MATVRDRYVPRMPPRNPWLADSVYPISHHDPAATEAVMHAGPTTGKALSIADIGRVPALFTSNPTVKTVGGRTIVIAAGLDGIRKIDATDEAFELVSYTPYPGFESLAASATPSRVQAVLEETNAARRANDDGKLIALGKKAAELGLTHRNMANGGYNLIDRDGCHFAPYGGLRIVKTSDQNDPSKPLRVVAVKDFDSAVPASKTSRIVGLGMTYDGNIAAAADGALLLVDRDLALKGTLLLPGEQIENGICTDDNGGIYVVTSKRMLKVVWTGSKLSYDEADGGWQAEYNTMSSEQAIASGALTRSGGSGTTPTLLGFGDDPDKLVVIADADPRGTNLVAFWRDKIPEGFRRKPGTKSARIADQIRIDISRSTIEPSPAVLGNGIVVLNTSYPKPVPDIWANAMTAGVTRPAPTGAQKLVWNAQAKAFEKAWLSNEVDNTDLMVPLISAKSGLVYAATKQRGNYEYIGIDWDTGETKARWQFPDDSRVWNCYGGITTLLENGDLLLGGLFAIKRVRIGNGNGGKRP
ncbi:MAG: hypothetical protein HOV81_43775 [Kofleriaceae bacterium]|nr:hypothetical protein [Kofleriaceae bacterium]